jgi:imidazolonepropionase-like amidohydrolase
MLRKLTTVVILCLAVSAHAHGNLKFTNGLWFNGTSFEKKTMYSVANVFRDEYDGEAAVIDLAGKYVVPPFGDAHNHAFADGADVDEQLARYLRAGVFYVKNPNNSASMTAPIRARVNTPETVDVLYANGGLTRTGGHPSQIYTRLGDRFSDAWVPVDSPADLDRKWPAMLAAKPGFVKIYLQHSEDPAANRGLDPALVPVIVARAHRDGLRVSAHVASAADFRTAVAAGVDEVTHLPLAPLTPADAEQARKKNVTVVTTILSHRPREGFTGHVANLTLLKHAGVDVVLGVDNDPTVVEETLAVARLGVYTNAELLRMLTETTPRAVFPTRKLGRLEAGYEASLLALDANPLDDLAALRQVSIRVKQGHVLQLAPIRPSINEALTPVFMTKGLEAALAEYHRLAAEEAEKWDFTEPQLNALGYALINHNQLDSAIAIFQLNAETFPRSANVWDSLAEAHMKAGRKEPAIANYRKSLELNPKNENAKEMLKKLMAE